MLAAVSDRLFELCAQSSGDDGQVGTGGPGGTAQEPKNLSVSTDGGKSWQPAGPAPAPGIATSLAVAPGQLIVVASTAGLYVSANGGSSWTRPQASPPGAAAGQFGFSYVGLTDQDQGVAVPADPRLHEVYITTNGGASWRPSVISAP